MDELAELRRKRMLELMKAQQNNVISEEQQVADAIAVMEREVRAYLDDKAYERLNNIKLVNKDLAVEAIYLLYQLRAAGRLIGKLSDDDFKKLLLQIMPKKREPKIVRR